jgi:hypothetical protein
VAILGLSQTTGIVAVLSVNFAESRHPPETFGDESAGQALIDFGEAAHGLLRREMNHLQDLSEAFHANGFAESDRRIHDGSRGVPRFHAQRYPPVRRNCKMACPPRALEVPQVSKISSCRYLTAILAPPQLSYHHLRTAGREPCLVCQSFLEESDS